ncbi:response regulator, partial [bacterium]|nr:response regulator [bacterium]
TPMNAVIGMSRLALKTKLTLKQSDLISSVYNSSTSLLALLNDILDLSKIEAGQLILECNSFSLFSFLNSLQDTMQTLADTKGVSFQVVAEHDTLPDHVKGDELRFRQILINLLNNAIKFTEKGSVKLEIKLLPNESDSPNPTLSFSVIDTGIGIPAEKLLHIFDIFSQADSTMARQYGGSGLGLAISKQLVEMMGGSLTVTSEVDSGSTFSFHIQLETGVGIPPTLVRKEERLHSVQAQAKILLVDDHPLNRKLALMILEQNGHQVDLAENGQQALKILAEKSFDLVFMDLQMPVLDGYRTTEFIRASEAGATISEIPLEISQKLQTRLAGGHLPVIALTAHAMSGDREKCLNAGMDDYLTKPFEPDDIFAIINRYPRVPDRTEAESEIISVVPPEVGSPENRKFGFSLPEIVFQHLKKEYQLGDEQIEQLIEVSRQNLRENLELLQKECTAENFTGVQQSAHALKGILLNQGLKNLAEDVLEIENEARNESLSGCQKRVAQLAHDLSKLM